MHYIVFKSEHTECSVSSTTAIIIVIFIYAVSEYVSK